MIRKAGPRIVSVFGSGALLALGAMWGCAAGPDYTRPVVDAPAAYKEASDWRTAEPRDDERRGEWWTVYGDPVLDDLERRAAKGSQTLIAAEAAYRSASAVARQAEASLWPTIGVDAGVTRSQQAVGISRSASGSQNVVTAKGPSTLRSAQLTASWELDLWGGLRRASEAGRASAAASLAEQDLWFARADCAQLLLYHAPQPLPPASLRMRCSYVFCAL